MLTNSRRAGFAPVMVFLFGAVSALLVLGFYSGNRQFIEKKWRLLTAPETSVQQEAAVPLPAPAVPEAQQAGTEAVIEEPVPAEPEATSSGWAGESPPKIPPMATPSGRKNPFPVNIKPGTISADALAGIRSRTDAIIKNRDSQKKEVAAGKPTEVKPTEAKVTPTELSPVAPATPIFATAGGLLPPPPEKYIVVKLKSVQIHNDNDPADNGEIQLVTTVRSGKSVQRTATPYSDWFEANDGNTWYVNKPIFVLREKDMGDKLLIAMTALDNDGLPSWGSELLRAYLTPAEILTSVPDSALGVAGVDFRFDPTNRFISWLSGSEHVGTNINVLAKKANFGIPKNDWRKHFTYRSGNATFDYVVYKSDVPKKAHQVDVTLKSFQGGETGDPAYTVDFYFWSETFSDDGDLYIWSHVTDGAESTKTSAVRVPGSDFHDVDDGNGWALDRNIYSAVTTSPVIYIESGVWDDDDTSNNDQLVLLTRAIDISTIEKPTTFNLVSNDTENGLDANGRLYIEVKVTPK